MEGKVSGTPDIKLNHQSSLMDPPLPEFSADFLLDRPHL